VELHVLGCPAAAEPLRAGGQLTDQLDECLVVGAADGLQAERGGGVVGDPVVVDEELLGCLRVQVDEPGHVGRPSGVAEHR
jgi:hypothetical protein